FGLPVAVDDFDPNAEFLEYVVSQRLSVFRLPHSGRRAKHVVADLVQLQKQLICFHELPELCLTACADLAGRENVVPKPNRKAYVLQLLEKLTFSGFQYCRHLESYCV